MVMQDLTQQNTESQLLLRGTSRVGGFMEGLVLVAILLVLVQTFLEDWAVLAGWPVSTRNALALSGMGFDLFFTVEFLVRLFLAVERGGVKRYLLRDKGWIDFLASVPLLIFNSGPTAISILAGGTAAAGLGGMLNVLKVVKAIRIARVLRLLRIIKLFRRIKHADSVMAQRHVSSVATLSITVLVFSLIGYSLIAGALLPAPGLEQDFLSGTESNSAYLSRIQTDFGTSAATAEVATLADADDALLVARLDGQVVFSRYGRDEYARTFGPGDYHYVASGGVELFYDLRPISIEHSKQNLLYFVIVVLLVLAFTVFYSPHFAITVTDPLHVMRRGLQEEEYNLEVRIPPDYADDDVFETARLYNEVYLPLKDRERHTGESSVLDINSPEFSDLRGSDTPE